MADLFSNTECPCGSGRHYSDCCEPAGQGELRSYFEYQSLLETINAQLLTMAFQDMDSLRLMWRHVSDQRDLPPAEWPDFRFFLQWYVWHLRLTVVDPEGVRHVETHAATLLRQRRSSLDSTTLQLLEGSEKAAVSYWRVIAADPSGRMLLRDEILDHEREVFNPKDIGSLEPDDLICGSVVRIASTNFILTRAQLRIEPRLQGIIAQAREVLKAEQADPTIEGLNAISQLMMGGYLELADYMRDDLAQLELAIPKHHRQNPDWLN